MALEQRGKKEWTRECSRCVDDFREKRLLSYENLDGDEKESIIKFIMPGRQVLAEKCRRRGGGELKTGGHRESSFTVRWLEF